MKWKYEPQPVGRGARGRLLRCRQPRRRPSPTASIFFNTLDDQTVAVDAKTGKEVWRTRLGDINIGETITMAPLVVKGKVLVGKAAARSACAAGSPRSTQDGKIAWHAYSTGPDKDVLIGPDFKPFYDRTAARTSASPAGRRRPGSTAAAPSGAGSPTIPELDLIYYGTGNPGPWNPEMRPGDNKWTAGIFARDADTGEARLVLPVEPARPLRP